MKFDSSFPNRVSIARSAIGLTQDELAKKVGVVRRQIAAYEGGEARPRYTALENLAAALGTTAEWLTSGAGTGPDVSNIKRTVTVREIPVLSYSHAISFSVGNTDSLSAVDFIAAPQGAGGRAFALKLQGDSMTSQHGMSFYDGTLVTFDPDITPSEGDFVLASVCNLESDIDNITFKQLILDQGSAYLKPLNPHYPIMPLTDMGIIAVAIHAQYPVPHGGAAPLLNDAWEAFERLPAFNPVDPGNAELVTKVDSIEKKLNTLIDLMSGKKNQ